MGERERQHYSYGVSKSEVEAAVSADPVLSAFLKQYDRDVSTYWSKAKGLVRFFKWLRLVKGLELSPKSFLAAHVAKRRSRSVVEKRWALNLALDYSRDNADLAGLSDVYRYNDFFLPVKLFCDFYEEPLTTAQKPFKMAAKRRFRDQPFSAEEAGVDARIKTVSVKKALSALSQREKTVALVQLQSGQSDKQTLVDISLQAQPIFEELEASGKQPPSRIKFEFKERKGNGFEYFSYISVDAIQEILKYRVERAKILKRLGVQSDYLFITEKGHPLGINHYLGRVREAWIRDGLYTGPYSVRPHCFRKFFEQEASPPERGVSRAYVMFMMGHLKGGELLNSSLDSVGGTYDRAPHVYPGVVEKEYAKLEPYLNIYSGQAAISPFLKLSANTRQSLAILGDVLENDPDLVKDLKELVKKRIH